MKTLLWLLLIPSLAFGQITQYVTQQQYATRAVVALFVGPTGSDASQCLSAMAPCLTIQGAVNKLPKRIRHNVAITVAAGTYAENVVISGFTFTSEVSLPTFTITGTMGAFVPTTSTASGTFTTVAGVATGGYVQRVTDNTKAWTVNDLRGQFLTVAGVSRPIISNTATTIDVANTAVFVNGNAYTITTPTSLINAAAGVTVSFAGNMGAGTVVTMSQFGFTSVNQTINVTASPSGIHHPFNSPGAAPSYLFSNVQSTGFSIKCVGAFCSFSRSYVSHYLTCTEQAECGFTETFLRFANNSNFSGVVTLFAGATLRGGGSPVIENTHATGHVLYFINTTMTAMGGGTRGRFICPSGATGYGVATSTSATATFDVVASPVRFQNGFSAQAQAFEVEECAVGFKGHGDVWLANNTTAATAWYFNNVATAFDIAYGAKIILGTGSTFTFTNVTNQFKLDGVQQSLATLDAATPKLITNTYGTLLAR